jgi:hypothetical protein
MPVNYKTTTFLETDYFNLVSDAMNAEANHPGVLALYSYGLPAVSPFGGAILLPGATTTHISILKVPVLSVISNEYYVQALMAPMQNADYGVFFLYDRANCGDNWQTVTRDGGVQTLIDTGIPVTTNWITLELRCNFAADSIGFYVDGVLVSTHTTNIPQLPWTATNTSITGTYLSLGYCTLLLDYESVLQGFAGR